MQPVFVIFALYWGLGTWEVSQAGPLIANLPRRLEQLAVWYAEARLGYLSATERECEHPVALPCELSFKALGGRVFVRVYKGGSSLC